MRRASSATPMSSARRISTRGLIADSSTRSLRSSSCRAMRSVSAVLRSNAPSASSTSSPSMPRSSAHLSSSRALMPARREALSAGGAGARRRPGAADPRSRWSSRSMSSMSTALRSSAMTLCRPTQGCAAPVVAAGGSRDPPCGSSDRATERRAAARSLSSPESPRPACPAAGSSPGARGCTRRLASRSRLGLCRRARLGCSAVPQWANAQGWPDSALGDLSWSDAGLRHRAPGLPVALRASP
eukprot:COSAG04_NODE_166_length_21733_cov_6396.970925_3_plen_243_part_00